MEIVCVTILFSSAWIIGPSIGQTVNVTESVVVGNPALDYQYEDLNPETVPSNNGSSSNGNRTGNQGGEDGGLFYPLYGEAIKRRNSPRPGEDGPERNPPGLATRKVAQPLQKVFPDYTAGEDVQGPIGRTWRESMNQWGDPRWRQYWGREGQPIIGEGYQVPVPPKAMPFWNNGGMRRDDMMESLRKEFQMIDYYGLNGRLDELQRFYPHINVTRMYDSFQKHSMGNQQFYYGESENEGENIGYWHNGTFYYYPRQAGYEADEGFWHGDTFYPYMDEIWEDGFWYNGTFYRGENEGLDLEDGYFYNGTFYHIGEAGEPDLEDGFFYNGTFYPALWNDEQEYDTEDLMWWQLHHPKWQDRTNSVEQMWGRGKGPQNVKTSAHPLYQSLFASMGIPFPANKPNVASSPDASSAGSQRASTVPKKPSPREWPSKAVNPPWMERRTMPYLPQRGRPQFQQGQRIEDPRNYFGRFPQSRGNQAKFAGRNRGYPRTPSFANNQRGPFFRGDFPSPQNRKGGNMPGRNPPIPVDFPRPIAAGQKGEVVRKTKSPLDPYRDGSTAAIGIIFACILGLTLILSPLICMLYTYKKNKRMKKRTFLRRPELSTSVEEGLVDTMVHTELGAIGGMEEQLPLSKNPNDAPSHKKGMGLGARSKTKGTELTEKRLREKRGYREGRRGKDTRVGDETEMEMIEIKNANRARQMTSRPLPSPPPSPSSSFLRRHQQYAPRNTLIGAREELRQEQNVLPAPMTVIGMDSDDELRVVGK